MKRIRNAVMIMIAIAGLTLAIGRPVEALQIGDQVQYSWLFPDTSTTFDTQLLTVGLGVELVDPLGSSGAFNIDLDPVGNLIRLDADQTGSFLFSSSIFNGFLFSDILSSLTAFMNVTLNSTNIAGMTAGNISFDADNIFLNFQSLNITSGSFAYFDVQQTPIPEPATVALLGIGLAGLAGAEVRRRRKKKAVD